jgi:hypothetical protein
MAGLASMPSGRSLRSGSSTASGPSTALANESQTFQLMSRKHARTEDKGSDDEVVQAYDDDEDMPLYHDEESAVADQSWLDERDAIIVSHASLNVDTY